MNVLLNIFTELFTSLGKELLYQPDSPLLFTQPLFWYIFMAAIAGYSLFYQNIKFRSNYLLLISLYFYYKCSGGFVILLIISIILNYYLGNKIHKSEKQSRKKIYLFLSILVSLLMLGYFKYTLFITDILNNILGTQMVAVDYLSVMLNSISGSHFDISTIILPAGISFFTFRALSYTIDLYRKDIEPVKNISDFGFYLAFFPQLLAGPIARASEFVPQIYKKYQLSQKEFGIALFLIIAGLIKKMVISDYISLNFVDRIFENPSNYSGFENLLGVYGYTLQIYCDFSGYTDIAIGISLLLGFKTSENFKSPYKAVNLTDFWRRWHISLSSWLRDYLYIPLGGNRKGEIRTYINLFLTMLLGGLWHGANWRFILWGGVHGLGLAVDKLIFRKKKLNPKSWGYYISVFVTFHIVAFAWIFFKASSMQTVGQILSAVFTNTNFAMAPRILSGYWKTSGLIALGLMLHWLPLTYKEKIKEYFVNTSIFVKIAICILVIIFIYQFKSSALQPFIYFQF
jgi:alginate O-acetyltransferase complex protein AlgI